MVPAPMNQHHGNEEKESGLFTGHELFLSRLMVYQQKYNLPAVLTLLSTQASPPALLACAILEINLSYARNILRSVWGVFC